MLLLREEKQAAYLSFGLPSSLCSIFLSSIPFVVYLPWFQPWKPLSQANFSAAPRRAELLECMLLPWVRGQCFLKLGWSN